MPRSSHPVPPHPIHGNPPFGMYRTLPPLRRQPTVEELTHEIQQTEREIQQAELEILRQGIDSEMQQVNGKVDALRRKINTLSKHQVKQHSTISGLVEQVRILQHNVEVLRTQNDYFKSQQPDMDLTPHGFTDKQEAYYVKLGRLLKHTLKGAQTASLAFVQVEPSAKAQAAKDIAEMAANTPLVGFGLSIIGKGVEKLFDKLDKQKMAKLAQLFPRDDVYEFLAAYITRFVSNTTIAACKCEQESEALAQAHFEMIIEAISENILAPEMVHKKDPVILTDQTPLGIPTLTHGQKLDVIKAMELCGEYVSYRINGLSNDDAMRMMNRRGGGYTFSNPAAAQSANPRSSFQAQSSLDSLPDLPSGLLTGDGSQLSLGVVGRSASGFSVVSSPRK